MTDPKVTSPVYGVRHRSTGGARPITQDVLEEFFKWTVEAPMFLDSPEGRAFGSELRDVICLARKGLNDGK